MDNRNVTILMLLKILRYENQIVDKSRLLKLWDFIKNNPSHPTNSHCLSFQLNIVQQALLTIDIAINNIRLKGDILIAAVLWMFYASEEDEKIEKVFGSAIAQTFSTLHKVYSIDVKLEALKSDNFRNLLVSQASDMRVILLLIAYYVGLMRNIKDTANLELQKRISLEAAHVYAPLAHKLGLYQLKSELEDLSLKYLEHDAYYHIKEELNATKRSRDAYIERFISPIREMLDHEGVVYHMKGRTKSIHSIWQKMKKQHCSFHGVYDLFAIRIIIDAPPKKEKELCWKVFSLITAKYESNLKRLRDWITVPKANGYESLHITVLGPEDKWVEVQIRTERMDEVAEHGLAAHWRYKGVKSNQGVDAWLADIRNALETENDLLLTNSLSGTDNVQDIYVFTPKGDLYRLPAKATVLDFAYYIHTEVGNHCVGAKIDGKNVPIRHLLESGKKVEILTSSTQMPKMEWVNTVVSSHAKSKIRTSVRDIQSREASLGREVLERKLKNRKIEWDEGVVNQLIKKSGFKESFDFYKKLYEETIDMNSLIELYQDLYKRETGMAERVPARSAEEYNFDLEKDKQSIAIHGGTDVLVIDRNLKGIDFQMAKCCNPVYGDDVFGFVTVNGGIKIHRVNCPNAPALHERFGYRIVPAKWAGKGVSKYAITLHIVGNDDLGIVNNITSIISKESNIMLRSISIDSHDGLFSGVLTVLIDDTNVLNLLIKKLRTVKGVKAVSRT